MHKKNNVVERFNTWSNTYDNDFNEFELNQEVLYKIVDIVKSSSPDIVLDIGTGTGLLIKELSKNLNSKFVGIDISDKMLLKAKKNLKNIDVELKIGSFLSIPLENNSVDLVVSNFAMHHLTNIQKKDAINEIKRVLKIDGRVIIGDIIFFEEFDWSNTTKDNLMEKIEHVFGDEVEIKDLCCNIDRIIEMLNDEYPSYICDLEKMFKEGGFYVQIDRIKYWTGIITASIKK